MQDTYIRSHALHTPARPNDQTTTGLAFVARLVSSFDVKHLVLVSRRLPKDDVIEILNRLESQTGAKILVKQADTGSSQQV